jgi:hypothetical protein
MIHFLGDKVKFTLQSTIEAQRGTRFRHTALLFFNLDPFSLKNNSESIVYEDWWASGPVWMGAENVTPPQEFFPRTA